jgi:hypothetical protein
MKAWNRSRLAKSAGFVIAAAVAVAGLWPVTSLSAPLWDVCVVDSDGRPAQDVLVREAYQDYSVETVGHEEDRHTDQRGVFNFRLAC